MNRKHVSGFSLIELLIVVVIIGIIMAIAIPNLLAARRSANYGEAISTMRQLIEQKAESGTYESRGYTITVQNSGGKMDVTAVPKSLYPESISGSGEYSLYTNEANVMSRERGSTAPGPLGNSRVILSGEKLE
jgi:prepilin-type N-terminal cleavage/methylation domain-containing protein